MLDSVIYVRQINWGTSIYVLDLIMHNLDPQVAAPRLPHNGLFHTYVSRTTINDHFKNGKIISGHFHPQYSKYVIVAYCQDDKMLGLIALQADIGVNEQYESGMYFCRFSEGVTLATSRSRQYFCQNVSAGAIMLPLTISNVEFHLQNSVIYSNPMVTRDGHNFHMIYYKYNLLSYIYDKHYYFSNFHNCCVVDTCSPFFILSLWGQIVLHHINFTSPLPNI